MIRKALVAAMIYSLFIPASFSFAADGDSSSAETTIQKGDSSSAETTIQKVYDLPEKKRDQIYDLSMIWYGKNFNSIFKGIKANIQYESKQSGVILVNVIMPYESGGRFSLSALSILQATIGFKHIHFILKEEIKDNKIRVTFEDIRSVNTTAFLSSGQPDEKPLHKEFYKDVTPKLTNMSDKLAEYVKTAKGGDDW